jgi:FdrA protein
MGLNLLHEDPQTEIICILSKPPHPVVAKEILRKAKRTGKPVVACFIGLQENLEIEGVAQTLTIEEAAIACAALAGSTLRNPFEQPEVEQRQKKQSGAILGLFAGGTLAYEAMQILRGAVGSVYSNAPLSPDENMPDAAIRKHTCLDLGAEEYTLGRPHPMIDGRWRADMVAQAGENEEIGIVLLDVILGTGSDPDPAGVLADGIRRARESSQKTGRSQVYIASVTGTEIDMQNYSQQVATLQSLGVIVAPTNASAARLAADMTV